jgi:GTPase SAR1 family protein
MLIGILGEIGSGKTTSARYLCNKWFFEEYIIAEPLKDIAKIFGFSDSDLYGTQQQKLKIHPKWGISAREFLQKVGTDLFRDQLPKVIPGMKIDKSIWCDIFTLKHNIYKDTVVSDIRFQDEAETVKELGGYLIRIERYDAGNYNTPLHRSEVEMKHIMSDFTIVNNGNIELLYEQLDKIVLQIQNHLKKMAKVP